MQAASNRTFICSVVFLDIVGYSKKPVGEQILLKERLNNLLTEALANVAVNDRIILDTGDGAALSFLGDPEDALFVSLMIRDAVAAPDQHGPVLDMRIGINLGPVKLVKDINGQPNIIGDGINVAQRVMSFSVPGQVLVSRSYYEVVSCLAEEYARLFHYEGSRTDKHVRDHEVYAVNAASGVLQRVAAAAPRKKTEDTRGRLAVFEKLSNSAAFVTDTLRRRPPLGTALAVIVILAIAVGIRWNRQPPAEPVAAPKQAPKVAAAPAPARAPVKDAIKTPVPDKPVAVAPKPGAAPAKPAPASKPGTPAAPPPGPATVSFTILPWGEVYINGKLHGVTPPLRSVEIKPGRYKIEIRNADFPPHVEVVDAKAGSQIRIRHRFR